ncbi:GNAT family N-acetyltransferase [Robiginitalea aurantiaca]|uniref:GNAT family N-acetyltransferase n=1 Tax=Robiginitalea aurantiaca TaxID=3056915 RepID=A0ABT7WDL0_9FLAO|nr:GNAT family N-acetyltransferase [Robiginitalea aurantiaca]MDM9630894.1 GNAT family N-acetyltransferase [Robiginitalea aurantiaca]
MYLVTVTPENAIQESFFCIKDTRRQGFKDKLQWFGKRFKEGLRIKILKNEEGKRLGFIEYVPGRNAWRPIDADNYMFIHCTYIYSMKERSKGYGSILISEAEKEAKALGMDGLCVMTSNGGWLANKDLFRKNGFEQIETKDRFELLSKTWIADADKPKFHNWTEQQKKYKGWHLRYADQCPWNEKSVFAILNVALDYGVELKVSKINTVNEAKRAPSGFGVFSLLHNGKLLDDHYLSATRFRNILKSELDKDKGLKQS